MPSTTFPTRRLRHRVATGVELGASEGFADWLDGSNADLDVG